MRISFLPRMRAKQITDLTAEQLTAKGIKLLMMDFDNTVVPYTTNVPTDAVVRWLETMKGSEVKLCVVSNSKKERVEIFCREYGLDCITHAKKPFPKGIRECLKRYGLQPSECALVGDQIYTDTLGANGCGVTSILVEAIDNHNFWLKARHVLELPWICMARERGN